MSKPRKLFIVGCPRSGTTWAQFLLAQHPDVATAPETHLFEKYVRPLTCAWRRDCSRDDSIGLHGLYSDDEFFDALRQFAERAFQKIANGKGSAQIIVEKTPRHIFEYETILRLYPDAHFLHLIRDPRSVCASLRAANLDGWGQGWAPRDAGGAAQKWLSTIELRKPLAAATGNYREIRYEDLLHDAPAILARLFDWLELEATLEFCRYAAERCRMENLRDHEKKRLPHNSRMEALDSRFMRTGKADSWKQELSARDVQIIEFITRDIMTEFGYEPATPQAKLPLSMILRNARRQLWFRVAPSLRTFAKSMAQ